MSVDRLLAILSLPPSSPASLVEKGKRWIAALLAKGEAIPASPPPVVEDLQPRQLLSASLVSGVIVETYSATPDTIEVYRNSNGIYVQDMASRQKQRCRPPPPPSHVGQRPEGHQRERLVSRA